MRSSVRGVFWQAIEAVLIFRDIIANCYCCDIALTCARTQTRDVLRSTCCNSASISVSSRFAKHICCLSIKIFHSMVMLLRCGCCYINSKSVLAARTRHGLDNLKRNQR